MAIGYTTTDGEGHYILSIRSGADSVIIAVSGMSVKAVRRTVPNAGGRYDFEVEESMLELNEVRVTAPKMEMKGDDTVSYNVASFRSQEDMVIEDVIRKLPGITVRDNGTQRSTVTLQGQAHSGPHHRRHGPAQRPVRHSHAQHLPGPHSLRGDSGEPPGHQGPQGPRTLRQDLHQPQAESLLAWSVPAVGGSGRRLRGRRPMERRGRAHVLRAQQPAHPHRQDQQHR